MGRLPANLRRVLRLLFSGRGMLGVLLLLCLFFTWATYHEERPTGREGAETLAESLLNTAKKTASVVVVSQTDATDAEFAAVLQSRLQSGGFANVTVLKGDPPTVR